jgi:thiol-disulfide isomerase/thioredoxin
MFSRWFVVMVLVACGTVVRGLGNPAMGQEAKPATPSSDPARAESKPATADPSMAERLAAILAEYEAQNEVLRQAVEKATNARERNEAYGKSSPDEVGFCRRMIDLALTHPKDPSARDALRWVIDKPGRQDAGTYGDEFARASALLVRHHGDDPDAISVGLGLSNVLTAHRDALLLGFYASAKSRESQGLARLALAQYLERKALFAKGTRKATKRQTIIYRGIIGDDGKPYDKHVEQSDEDYAYVLALRLCDADAIKAEAERLFEEVLADYGDIPLVTRKDRELEALLKDPSPKWNGKPLTDDEKRKLAAIVARKKTLGGLATARLDEMHNLTIGKPAPEIDGVDFDGKPLKLSDYRGKVVVLVFWGSWCGPCMREVPHEREMAEKYKGRPFALLGVDCSEEKSAGLKAILDNQMTWPNWHDGADGNGPIVSRYHIRGYPTVFVLDAQGAIRHKQALGEALDRAVEDLLKEAETPAQSK